MLGEGALGAALGAALAGAGEAAVEGAVVGAAGTGAAAVAVAAPGGSFANAAPDKTANATFVARKAKRKLLMARGYHQSLSLAVRRAVSQQSLTTRRVSGASIDPESSAMLSERRSFTVSVHKSWKGIGRYSTVGLDLALSILVGLFGGRWLDRKFGAGGWLTLVGFGFGVAAGARAVWRALKEANREAEASEQKDREARAKFHEDRHR